MEEFLKLIEPLIVAYAGDHGITLQIITIMGSLRALMKPIVEICRIYVKYTPKIEDDSKLEKVINSKYYKMAAFVLDWGGSIKLPK